METELKLRENIAATVASNSVQNNNAVHLLRLHLLFLGATDQLRIRNTRSTLCIIDLLSLAVQHCSPDLFPVLL